MKEKYKWDKYYNKYNNWEHIYCPNCGKSCYFSRNCKCICSHCGHMIYPTKKCEFKDKVEMLKRKKEREI